MTFWVCWSNQRRIAASLQHKRSSLSLNGFPIVDLMSGRVVVTVTGPRPAPACLKCLAPLCPRPLDDIYLINRTPRDSPEPRVTLSLYLYWALHATRRPPSPNNCWLKIVNQCQRSQYSWQRLMFRRKKYLETETSQTRVRGHMVSLWWQQPLLLLHSSDTGVFKICSQ